MWLRQSTASQEILLGPFLDSTDGNTQETGLTIANTDIKIWKEGGTSEANKNSGGATHIANGRYYAVLDATDTNTLGKLEVNCHPTGALAVRREFMVLPAMVYDSLVLGTDRFDVNVTHISDTAQTANDNGADINDILVDTAVIGTTGQGLTSLATAAELAKVPKSDGTASWNATALAAINAQADLAISDASLATASALATVDGIVDAILLDTAEIGAAGAGLTALATQASVNTIDGIVDAILVDTGTTLDTKLNNIQGATFDTATDSLEAIRNRGDAEWVTGSGSGLDAAGVRAAVGLASANLDTQLGTIDSNVDAVLVDTGTTLPATLSTIAGYIDTEIGTLQTSVNDLPTNAELATALGTADDAVLAAVATVDTVVDAIKVKTDQLTFTKANELDSNIQSVNGVTINGDGAGTPMGV